MFIMREHGVRLCSISIDVTHVYYEFFAHSSFFFHPFIDVLRQSIDVFLTLPQRPQPAIHRCFSSFHRYFHPIEFEPRARKPSIPGCMAAIPGSLAATPGPLSFAHAIFPPDGYRDLESALLFVGWKGRDLLLFVELGVRGGGTNPCGVGLDLSGSWQQGHSATYNAPPRI
jgi:hypothetical protein